MSLKHLKPNEVRLGIALAGILFVLLNLVLLPRLSAFHQAAQKRHQELSAQLEAAKDWIAKKDFWNTREAWLEETEPTPNVARQDSATQLELLQSAARKQGLKISDIQLLQLDTTEFYQPVGVRLIVTGPWSNMVHFISELQSPQLFDVIPRFHIRSDESPPNVRCELEVQRWFHISTEGTP